MHIKTNHDEILPDSAVDNLAGHFLDERHYDQLIQEDCRVDKPDGSPLLIFRRNVLPLSACEVAYRSLRSAATESDNRGMAGGIIPEDAVSLVGNERIGERSAVRWKAAKQDGTLSKTNRAIPVMSGIAGYFDRNARFPYCRLTAFNLAHPERFHAALPFIREVDQVFARELPERYAAQKAYIERTNPDFYIHGTVFTTLTVNKNWRTAVHKDAGDLKAGFGVMSVLQAGQYSGGYLIFPKYRVAVHMRSRDVLLADVHEFHGNSPIVGAGRFERISCVFYYREAIEHCGSAAEELERAKRRRPGDAING